MHHSALRQFALPVSIFMVSLSFPCNAQDSYFPNDATIKSTVRGKALVGYTKVDDIGNANLGTSPTVTFVNGNTISLDLQVFNRSSITFRGGSIQGILYAQDNSTVTISGGSLRDIVACNVSTVNLLSGRIAGDVWAGQHSTVNIRGGNIGGKLYAREDGTFNLIGKGLSKTLVDAKAEPAPGGDAYYKYALAGILSDGTSLKGKFLYIKTGSHPQVNLIQNVDIARLR